VNGWRRPALLTALAVPTVVVLVNRMVVEKCASPRNSRVDIRNDSLKPVPARYQLMRPPSS
jgi:hypothetical protein